MQCHPSHYTKFNELPKYTATAVVVVELIEGYMLIGS